MAAQTRIIKNGWTNFQRNSYLSFGTTGVMALCLILFMGLLSLQFLTTDIVGSLEDKVDISVYFKAETAEDQILKIKDDISKLPETKVVNYTSKDQALQEFKTRHVNDSLIQESLAQLETNPLTASLNIRAQNPNQYATIAQALENNKLRSTIDKINYYENKNVIDRIQNISQSIGHWGLLSTLALASIAILVTFNTIRLTIYNQKKEIEIMRLVGASNAQIRGPYLIEGGFYGLFAGLIALVLFYPGLYLVSGQISTFTSANIWSYFLHGLPEIFVMVVGLGIVLGITSSSIAIRKYLKI